MPPRRRPGMRLHVITSYSIHYTKLYDTRPRPLKGRCGACAYKAVCGGNTRIRALQLTGDPWAEDPACYLDASEIGLAAEAVV